MLCPFADLALLSTTSPSYSGRRLVATQVIGHSIADPGATAEQLHDYWDGPDSNGDSAHFFVGLDGRITQYLDTDIECYASAAANLRPDGTGAIAFESANAAGADPDTEPWTPPQITSIIRLCRWLADTHPGIPRQVCRTPDSPGYGYHSMWGYNTAANPHRNPWTVKRGKTCPGLARIPQWTGIIIPAVLAGDLVEDDDMAHLVYAIEPGQIWRLVNLATGDVTPVGPGEQTVLDQIHQAATGHPIPRAVLDNGGLDLLLRWANRPAI